MQIPPQALSIRVSTCRSRDERENLFITVRQNDPEEGNIAGRGALARSKWLRRNGDRHGKRLFERGRENARPPDTEQPANIPNKFSGAFYCTKKVAHCF
ncbi:hypothetical protein CDAR_366681 [Caerostris darwini]|uniref:Uncharacterized protein n=1 Tax=Caerostris darwini TaxID=1538125 RepID=A0AAV4Q2V7_9ARAC|nr:hypothetical protein CDAR_366681 [Caerostris darwini]